MQLHSQITNETTISPAQPSPYENHFAPPLPTKPFAYLITELDSTIVAYEWDGSTGTLGETGTIPTLLAAYDGANQPSEIVVHPTGKWVYGANRGRDSIAVSTVQADGNLEFVETLPTGGEWPRYFAIDPIGEVLFVQNRKSGDVVPFQINPIDGTLTEIEGATRGTGPVVYSLLSMKNSAPRREPPGRLTQP